jgi:hypothetical protein
MKSLKDGRTVAHGKIWFPNRPLISDRAALPFSALLQQAQDMRGAEPFCVESPKTDQTGSKK